MQITKEQIITKDKLEVLTARLLIGDYLLFELQNSSLIRAIKLGNHFSSSNLEHMATSWKLLLPKNDEEVKSLLARTWVIYSFTISMDLFLIKYHELNR